jgi:hypothetical protein
LSAQILDAIFKASNSPKKCRLVCNKWNEKILSTNPPRFQLKLKLYNHQRSSTHGLQLERKLARNIYLDCHQFTTEEIYLVDGDLKRFCEKYGQEVQHIEFQIESEDFEEDLQYVLVNNLCPNLRSLEGFVFNIGVVSFDSLPQLPKFESLRISFSNWRNKVFFWLINFLFKFLIITIFFFSPGILTTANQ